MVNSKKKIKESLNSNSDAEMLSKSYSEKYSAWGLLKLDIQKYWIPFTIILVSAFLLYANTIKNDYALDDQLAIYENKFVTKGFDGFKEIMTKDAFVGFFGERGKLLIAGGRYRPFSFLTFATEWEFFGESSSKAGISHGINALLYGILCCLIFYFLIILLDYDQEMKYQFLYSIPFVATLLYTFHPIHTEVVANIKGRDEILCFLFATLSLIYFFHLSRQRIIDVFVLSFLFFCALMSKENAVTFLGIFFLVAWYKSKGYLQEKYWPSYIGIFVVTAGFLFLRSKYTVSAIDGESKEILNNPYILATTGQKYATIIFSFFKYIALLVFPATLTHDYYYNQIPYRNFGDPLVIGTLLFILGVFIIVLKKIFDKSIFVFGVLFFVITFSIVSNLFFTVGIIMNERFVFISSLGFCLLVAWLFQRLLIKTNQFVYLFVLASVLGIYSFKTITRNLDWKNNDTLFCADYHTSRNSAKVSTSYGGSLLDASARTKDSALKRQILDSSIAVLRHGIEVYPTNSQTWLLYGNAIYERNKNMNEAIGIYQKCLDFRDGSFFDADYNLAVIYYNMGKYDSCLVHVQKANAIQPDHKESRQVLSRCLAKLGRTQEAMALGLESQNSNELSALALDAKEGNNYDEAFKLADQALLLNSQDQTANYVKGLCLARHYGKIQEGIPFLERAIKIGNVHSTWKADLAVAYGMTGRFVESIQILEEIAKKEPSQTIYGNLATSYAKIGNMQKAQYYMQLAQQSTPK